MLEFPAPKEKRPELDRLMADAHRRRFDAVAVWRFDRLARSTSHLLRALETFKALGIEFCFFSEQMDTSTPAGKMVFTVLGAVAELERSLIVERVKSGLRNARAKGKTLGRPQRSIDARRIAELRARVGMEEGRPRTGLRGEHGPASWTGCWAERFGNPFEEFSPKLPCFSSGLVRPWRFGKELIVRFRCGRVKSATCEWMTSI